MEITLITPCSRPQNIEVIRRSINFPCRWFVVYDSDLVPDDALTDPAIINMAVKGGVAGKQQCNAALDVITDGWVYVLDDDNLIHPDFYATVDRIVEQMPHLNAVLLAQQTGHGIREVSPRSVRVGGIDQAQYIIRRDIIGNLRFVDKYEADGIMIEAIYQNTDQSLFYFYNKEAVTYYNKLRW